jgi:hypothetical protein
MRFARPFAVLSLGAMACTNRPRGVAHRDARSDGVELETPWGEALAQGETRFPASSTHTACAVGDINFGAAACEFRFKPATYSDLMSATVPI